MHTIRKIFLLMMLLQSIIALAMDIYDTQWLIKKRCELIPPRIFNTDQEIDLWWPHGFMKLPLFKDLPYSEKIELYRGHDCLSEEQRGERVMLTLPLSFATEANFAILNYLSAWYNFNGKRDLQIMAEDPRNTAHQSKKLLLFENILGAGAVDVFHRKNFLPKTFCQAFDLVLLANYCLANRDIQTALIEYAATIPFSKGDYKYIINNSDTFPKKLLQECITQPVIIGEPIKNTHFKKNKMIIKNLVSFNAYSNLLIIKNRKYETKQKTLKFCSLKNGEPIFKYRGVKYQEDIDPFTCNDVTYVYNNKPILGSPYVSPNGRYVVTKISQSNIIMWDTCCDCTRDIIHKKKESEKRYTRQIEPVQDSNMFKLVTYDSDKNLIHSCSQCISQLISAGDDIKKIHFSPDSQWTFYTDSGNKCCIIDNQKRIAIDSFLFQCKRAIIQSISPDKAIVLAVPGFVYPDTIELFNIQSKTSALLKVPKKYFVKTVSFNDNNTCSAKLWNLNSYNAESWTINTQTGEKLSSEKIEDDEYYKCKKLSANQSFSILYTKSIIELFNKKRKVMALNTAHDDKSLNMFNSQVKKGDLLSAVISPNNKLIATQTSDKICIWNVPLSQKSIRTITKKQLAFMLCFIKMNGTIPGKDVLFYSQLPESIRKRVVPVQWNNDDKNIF